MTKLLLLPLMLLNAAALAHPHDVPPVEPINNTIEYDHSYTPQELIEQLRDDDIRGNLLSAKGALMTHPDLSPGILYNALNHEDWQVRQVVCQMIWNFAQARRVFVPNPAEGGQWNGGQWETIEPDPRYRVTDDLVRVTIEGLKDDTTPFDTERHRGLVYFNASFGVGKLIPIARDWKHLLEPKLESTDKQQQFLVAYIMARGGVHESVERISEILLPHLRDNTIREDAKFAAYALGGMGPELLPYLRDALIAADAQQRDLVQLLIVNIMDPPITQAEIESRARYNTITQTVHDPASQRPSSATWSWLGSL